MLFLSATHTVNVKCTNALQKLEIEKIALDQIVMQILIWYTWLQFFQWLFLAFFLPWLCVTIIWAQCVNEVAEVFFSHILHIHTWSRWHGHDKAEMVIDEWLRYASAINAMRQRHFYAIKSIQFISITEIHCSACYTCLRIPDVVDRHDRTPSHHAAIELINHQECQKCVRYVNDFHMKSIMNLSMIFSSCWLTICIIFLNSNQSVHSVRLCFMQCELGLYLFLKFLGTYSFYWNIPPNIIYTAALCPNNEKLWLPSIYLNIHFSMKIPVLGYTAV